MSTGIETWNMNLLDIGPLYPFAGSEGFLALIGIVSWVVWHVIQISKENKMLAEEANRFKSKTKLKAAMKVSSAETITEELAAHHNQVKG